jgi:hypothetical protein
MRARCSASIGASPATSGGDGIRSRGGGDVMTTRGGQARRGREAKRPASQSRSWLTRSFAARHGEASILTKSRPNPRRITGSSWISKPLPRNAVNDD